MDARIRAHERDGDEAGALRLRLQAGDLSEATLRLAARAGFSPAAAALGSSIPGPPPLPADQAHHLQVASLGDWAQDLFSEQEPSLWIRGILGAVAGRTLPLRASERRAREALEIARAWLECPCAEHSAAADRARFHRSFAHCDDVKITLEGAALVALEVAAGEASPARAATAIRILTHPIGGDSPAHVRDALLAALRPEWAPLL